MNIHLSFITYNRLEYTKKALSSILKDSTEEFSLTIWDNASTDGTQEYLKNEINDSRVENIVLSKENVGQTVAVNNIWSNSKADLLGKLDNDCIVTPGWTRTFAQAHEDIPELGVVAMWHFFPEDFNHETAKHKIQNINGHAIFRHPWTCGTGLLIKRKTFQLLGTITEKATTQYWLKMARAGYINGFYYPLIYQEHMDDPRSSHCYLHKMTFDQAYKHTYGFQAGKLTDIDNYKKLHKDILRNLMEDSFEPSFYSPWRRRLKRFFSFVKR
jgi:glycosyltransferase involved in cell wall biosynthesis